MALQFRAPKLKAHATCYIIRKADKDRMKREAEKKAAEKKVKDDEEGLLVGDEPP